MQMSKKFAQLIATAPKITDALAQTAQASTSTTQQQSTESPKKTATTEPQDSVAKDGEKSTVKAQQLAEARPEPPAVPDTKTAADEQDAPGTGESSLPSDSKVTAQKHDEQAHTPTQEDPGGGNDAEPPVGASPTSSHTDSSKTMKTSPADNDSPEEPHASASPIAVEDADLPTLKSMKRETKNECLECLNKRIKTVQSDKGNVSTSSSPTPDIEMEVVD